MEWQVGFCSHCPPSLPAGMMRKRKQTKSKQPRTNLMIPTRARTRGSRRARMAGRTARSRRRTRRRGTRRRAGRVRARRPSRRQVPEEAQGWRKPRPHPEAARVMAKARMAMAIACKQASKGDEGCSEGSGEESAGGHYLLELAGSSFLWCLSR